MTSATDRPASSTGGYQEERHGRGFMAFASILLFVIGFFNVIYGVAAIGGSNVFVADAHYVIGDLRTWGWSLWCSAAHSSSLPSGSWEVTSWPAGSPWP